jgi:serine/threonine protein kinase
VPPDTIIDGRYRLGPRLGRGGMADVHEAHDLRLDRPVAIKRYRHVAHGVGLRRFMAEAELLAGLSHPGLLTIFDVSFDGEHPFLVLRLAAGGTLRDRLDSGPLAQDRVAEIGMAIAEVLSYVHSQGIVHRDVKPSNVLFDADGDCYLADFGIARALGAAHLTDSREFVGTAAYLAPEQVVDREVGPAADVYALGLLLLECLTGLPEYTGTDVEMALARLSRPPRIPGDWGPPWRAVLSAMTATDPAARPDAARCAVLLSALREGMAVPMAVPKPRRTPVYAGIAGLAAAAAAAVLVFASGPTELPGRPVSDPAQLGQQSEQSEQAGQPTPVAETKSAPGTIVVEQEPPVVVQQQPLPQQPPGQGNGHGPGEKNKNKDKGKSGH